MSRIKKIITAAVCAVLCMTFVSCSMVSVNEEKDRAQVAAEVNGTQITKGEVLDQVDMTITGYGMTSREAFVEQYGADQLDVYKRQVRGRGAAAEKAKVRRGTAKRAKRRDATSDRAEPADGKGGLEG